MEKHRAIPQGYMTVGEIAKKMGVTVRTLQYYDKEGILTPSSKSEGGRRLYTHKDIIKLHQIQSMKYFGFSLEDIKTRLLNIETPGEVEVILGEQAKEIEEKIDYLKNVLESVRKLKTEVVQMEVVDWKRYADIIVALQTKSDSYWIVKYFSDSILDTMRERFSNEHGMQMLENYKKLIKKAVETQRSGHAPDSEQGQAFAKDWWDFVMKCTQGDVSMLSELFKMGDGLSDSEWNDNFSFDKEFIQEALMIYFTRIGHNPFEGMKEDVKA